MPIKMVCLRQKGEVLFHKPNVPKWVVLGDLSQPRAWFRFPADSRTEISTDFRVEIFA
jgi:hypothetical protein